MKKKKSFAHVLFGSVVNEPPHIEHEPNLEHFTHEFAPGYIAHAFCSGCGRHFQVTAGRAQEILHSDILPKNDEYIRLVECTLCCPQGARGAVIKKRPKPS